MEKRGQVISREKSEGSVPVDLKRWDGTVINLSGEGEGRETNVQVVMGSSADLIWS